MNTLVPLFSLIAFFMVLMSPLWAGVQDISIVSPTSGASINNTNLEVEYLYDPVVVGSSPKISFTIDGQALPATRGMSVKGDSPKPTASKEQPSTTTLTREKQTIQIPPKDCQVQLTIEGENGSRHQALVNIVWSGLALDSKKVGNLYVVVVGISDYQDDTISDLKLAAKDAKDFAECINRQEGGFYTKVDLKTLINKDASRDNVLDALDWLQKAVQSQDTAMLFLAGHGTVENGQFYYVPVDADDEKIRRTCVPFADIQTTATQLPCRTVVFLDACHSGGVGGGGAISTEITALLAGWQKAQTKRGAVMFASSTGQQLSQEKVSWMNGAFTKALLEGLSGEAHPTKTGPISITMLEGYISKRVNELTKNSQTPTTTKSLDLADFEFALAGDARTEKARLEAAAFIKEAEERAIKAVRDAFIAQQILIQRQVQIKDLEGVNSDGSFNGKIAELRAEFAEKDVILKKSVAALNEISSKNSVVVGSALSKREEELAESMKSANKKAIDVATAAMASLKKQIKLPDSY